MGWECCFVFGLFFVVVEIGMIFSDGIWEGIDSEEEI